jgi:CRISPR-associated endonuclease/helicase Cas3
MDPDQPEASAERAHQSLELLPPNSFEALSVPLVAARQWLRGETLTSFGDAGSVENTRDDTWRSGLPVGFVQRDGKWFAATYRDVRPGGVIVLPSTFGGLRAGNFNPASDEPVVDWADLGATLRSGRLTLRVKPGTHGAPPLPVDGDVRSPAEAKRELRVWLATVRGEAPPLLRLAAARRTKVVGVPAGDRWLLLGPRLPSSALRELGQGKAEAPDLSLTADDGSSAIGRAVSLDEHLAGVEAWARSLAAACGLPATMIDDLACAGRWHDLGKADPRFQVLLYGGDEIRAAAGRPLAKSGMQYGDRQAQQRAAEVARLPKGFRHEMASVALLQTSDAGQALLASCADPELVLHLVASHHGHARPFAPPEDHRGQPSDLRVRTTVGAVVLEAPADHRQDAVDSGIADRFFRLQHRYGWWGLAWLEAILRLADHRESEAEGRTAEESA